MEGRTVRHFKIVSGVAAGALLFAVPALAADDLNGSARANDPVTLQQPPTLTANQAPNAAVQPATGSLETSGPASPVPSVAPPKPATSAFESQRLGVVEEPVPADSTAVEAATSWLDPRTNEITRVGLALAGVLVLMVIVRGLVGRAPGLMGKSGRPSGVLEIIARYPVARGQSLVLLKMARRIVLVHQTGTSMTTISETADPDEVAGILARVEAGKRSPAGDRFPVALGRAERAHRSAEQHMLGSRAVDMVDGIEVVDLTRRGALRPEPVRTRRDQPTLAPEGVTA